MTSALIVDCYSAARLSGDLGASRATLASRP